MTTTIQQPYAFNERGTMASIIGSKVYDLFLRLANGEKLTREEKDNLFHMIQGNGGKAQYRLMGMVIPFKQFMTPYLVKYHYDDNAWREIWAFDKTCIRSSFYTGSDIYKIIDVSALI